MTDVERPAACAACGRALPAPAGKGRIRRYCDATCRSAARRQRESREPQAGIDVNNGLTDDRRHVSVDAMRDHDEPADRTAGRIRDTADSFLAGVPRPGAGSPLTAIAAARELAAAASAALQETVDRARAAGH